MPSKAPAAAARAWASPSRPASSSRWCQGSSPTRGKIQPRRGTKKSRSKKGIAGALLRRYPSLILIYLSEQQRQQHPRGIELEGANVAAVHAQQAALVGERAAGVLAVIDGRAARQQGHRAGRPAKIARLAQQRIGIAQVAAGVQAAGVAVVEVVPERGEAAAAIVQGVAGHQNAFHSHVRLISRADRSETVTIAIKPSGTRSSVNDTPTT